MTEGEASIGGCLLVRYRSMSEGICNRPYFL
jgi:hypothetical protein